MRSFGALRGLPAIISDFGKPTRRVHTAYKSAVFSAIHEIVKLVT